MLRRASDRLVLAGFALLAISSLGLKAVAGPPRDGLMDVPSGRLVQRLSSSLAAQNFAIEPRTSVHLGTMVVATRGACRLGVRDARGGTAIETAFARDAARIGHVRYLYRGRSYDQVPAFAIRLGRIETEVMSRLGMPRQAPMPIALAASPDCGTSDFGLADVRV
jgi:hypothetical protein